MCVGQSYGGGIATQQKTNPVKFVVTAVQGLFIMLPNSVLQ